MGFELEMLFNADPIKPAQEVLFPRKKKLVLLDEKLNFKQHAENAIMKVNIVIISTVKKLGYKLPQKSIVTRYKAILQPSTDDGDIIHDKPQNDSFCKKLKFVQYKAGLATAWGHSR